MPIRCKMRWKFDRDYYELYKCFGCLHVRSGTLLLGLLHSCFYLAMIALLIGAFSHPQWAVYFFHKNTNTTSTTPLPAISQNKESVVFFSLFKAHNFNTTHINTRPIRNAQQLFYDNVVLLLLIFVGSFIISSFLIYGTITGKAQYVTPFFCILVFHLCFSGMTFLGYFSDVPNIKRFIKNLPEFKMKDKLLTLDNDHLTLISVIFSVSLLSAMVYCIGVVWGCYKYLKYKEIFSSSRLRDYEMGSVAYNRTTEDTELLLPPKYEDVIRMSLQDAPPAYEGEEGSSGSARQRED